MAQQRGMTLPEERTDEEVLENVLAAIERDHHPRALNDYIVEAGGVRNPFQFASVRRQLLKALKPGGSHFHMTQARKWMRTTERWAEELGIEKGKADVTMDPALRNLEERRVTVQDTVLPESVKKAANTALDVFTARAGKRLDPASLDIAADALSSIIDRADGIARENEILKAWKDDATKARDDLTEVLRNLSKRGNLPQAAE
ncbi:hypothetical protein [Rhizobium giardinii]|uniref:hypothetical protein n=1 Tax=Rhizobium giardinii TaxID=56731 RepID=UPI003D6ED08F